MNCPSTRAVRRQNIWLKLGCRLADLWPRLELAVLVFERPELAGVGHLQPAILGLPLVESGRADPVLAAHLRSRHPRLLLLQHQNALFFREP